MTESKMPIEGDLVIYTDYNGEDHAATVVRAWNMTCINLRFHYGTPTSERIETSVCYGERGAKGTWCWP